MTRPIPILAIVLPFNIISLSYIVFAVLATVSIFSLVMFLCASHENQKEVVFMKKKLSLSKKHLLSSFNKANNMSTKAFLKMISRRKPVHDQREEEEEEDDEDYTNDGVHVNHDYVNNVDEGFEKDDAVWKKTIIKGGKCRPLEFSGKIEYDSEGNLVPNRKSIDAKKIISSNKQVVVS